MGEPESFSKTTGRRDRSHRAVAATLRKQKQRQRERTLGYQRVELTLPKDVAGHLASAAEITGGTTKEHAQYLLRTTAERYHEELRALSARAGAVWLKAVPFLPYAGYLTQRGAYFRVKDRLLTHDQWEPIYRELTEIHGILSRRGLSKQRIDAFFRRAAKKLSTTGKLTT